MIFEGDFKAAKFLQAEKLWEIR